MPATVVRISLAPVKSLGLVHPAEARLTAGGLAGDRRFWIQDQHGVLFGGKRNGALLRVHPSWDETTRELALAFPDGQRVAGIVEVGEYVDATLYGLPRPSRRVIGPWEAALSEYVGRPLTLLWAVDGAVDRGSEGGTVSLVSRASLERLGAEIGIATAVDGRRFRMSFEIDGVEAHAEDSWIGRSIRIGGATVALNGDIGRCVVTSRDPDTGVINLPTLVTLHAYRPTGRTEPLPFGVYGSVAEPGRISLGDQVMELGTPG